MCRPCETDPGSLAALVIRWDPRAWLHHDHAVSGPVDEGPACCYGGYSRPAGSSIAHLDRWCAGWVPALSRKAGCRVAGVQACNPRSLQLPRWHYLTTNSEK
jgi:hypothetical protein